MPDVENQTGSQPLPEEGVAQRLEKALERRHKRMTLPFRIFLWLLLLAGLASLGAYIFYHRWLADPENVRVFAQKQIGLLFPGKSVTVGSADFSLFGGLNLFEVKVAEAEDGPEVARLNQVHIDFDLAKLVRFSFLINNVTATDLFLDLVRTPEGRWNLDIPVSAGSPTGPSPFAEPFSLRLEGAFISLDDRFSDYSVSFPVNEASALSSAGNFSLWRISADFGGTLVGKWVVKSTWDALEKTLDAQFQAVEIDLGRGLRSRVPPRGKRVYDKFEPSGTADATGRISRLADGTWDWEVDVALNECSTRYFAFPVRAAGVKGNLHFTQEGVRFDGVTGSAMGGAVTISGRTDSYGPDAAVNVLVKAKGVAFDDEARSALPERVSRTADAFDPEGVMDVSVEATREAGKQKPYEISAEILPRGLAVTYEKFPLTIEGVTGRLAYAEGSLEIAEVSGSRGDMEVHCSGTVADFNSDPQLDITVAASRVPLVEDVRALLPEQAGRFWSECSLAGEADSEVLINRGPGQPVSVGVNVALRGARVLYDGFPYRLTEGAGEFSLRDGVFSTEGLFFEHGAARISIVGRAGTSSGEAELSVSAENVPIDDELKGALNERWRETLDSLRLSGEADAAVGLSRDADGRVQLTEMNVQLRGGALMPSWMPLGLGAARSSIGSSPEYMDIKGLEGWVIPDNSMVLLPVVRLAYLSRPAGRLSATGRLVPADGGDWWTADFNAGSVFAEDALAKRLPSSVRQILENSEMRGYADLAVKVEYEGGEDRPRAYYRLRADCGGVGLVFGKSFDEIVGRIDVTGESHGAADAFVSTGRLARMRFDGMTMGATSFSLEKGGQEAALHNFETEMLGGTVSGQGRLGLSPGSGYGFSTAFTGISLAGILEKVLDFRKEGLAGSLSGRLEAICLTGESRDLVGFCEANVKEGALWEVPLVLSVFNVLNLKVPERSQFTQAHIVCNFARGRLLVKEFSMSSEPATIFGKGTIGFDGTLDMTFHSRPGRIPVISLIAGEVGRNIIRARVTGTFSSPQTRLVPSGPFGALVNLIKAPFGSKKR